MEEISISSTPNIRIKTIEINNEGNKYKCQIQIIKNFIVVSLYINNEIKYEGNISLPRIQIQISTFINYNINDIFEEINILNINNFKLIKIDNKYKLKIEFIILRKINELYIELEEYNILNKDDILKEIIQLKEIINNKDNEIKSLKNELKQYKTINNLDNNFNIKLKEPIHKFNYHTSYIRCGIVLKDGRFATGSNDNTIIIYNNKTFKPDLTIKEHSSYVSCLTQLSSDILVSCSYDKTIKLYEIKGNEYKIIQTLNNHTDNIYGLIELTNKKLVSYSPDSSIIFYFKDNNQYIKDYHINVSGYAYRMIQTKENEICFAGNDNNHYISFYDLQERKIINKIDKIHYIGCFTMISKDLLIAGSNDKILIINVNSHDVIRTINTSGSSCIYTICMINENQLLTGDDNHKLKQWKIEGDNLILISTKENAHNNGIYTILKIGDNHILTGDYSGEEKIW